jgi:deoxyribonuclease V
VKIPRAPHRWSLSSREAIAVQQRLAASVERVPPRRPPRCIAGLDAAFSNDAQRCIAGVVLWDLRERAVLEQRTATRKLTFPHVPGLLSFREAPALLAALRKLRRRPDALICDGHGLAHPRRFGIACHVGVLTGWPSVGCAKSRLIGTHREPGKRRGSRARLEDAGEVVGSVLRTRSGVKPVFVSIGHRIDLDGAVRLVLDCAVEHRLPEPTRLADRLVAEAKRAAAGAGRVVRS